jgi:hypothetical protein
MFKWWIYQFKMVHIHRLNIKHFLEHLLLVVDGRFPNNEKANVNHKLQLKFAHFQGLEEKPPKFQLIS